MALDDVVALDLGAETTWMLRYRTPVTGGRYDLRVVPQPLAYDFELTLDVAPGADAHFRAVNDAGAFEGERHVVVRATRGSFWQRLGRRVRRFWSEPVRVR